MDQRWPDQRLPPRIPEIRELRYAAERSSIPEEAALLRAIRDVAALILYGRLREMDA